MSDFKAKCTKFDFEFVWGSPALPRLLAGFKGPTSKGGTGVEKGRGRRREGTEGWRRVGKGWDGIALFLRS